MIVSRAFCPFPGLFPEFRLIPLAIVSPRVYNRSMTRTQATNRSETMSELLKLKALNDKHLHSIYQLSLDGWSNLARELGVAGNDREHAAKILACREYHAS